MPVPIPASSTTTKPPSKKAVLVGITYYSNTNLAQNGWSVQPGAHNDVRKLHDLLTSVQYGYETKNITLLVDEPSVDKDSDLWPTRGNILKAAERLVAEAQADDHIVFAFSGHGHQVDAIVDKNERDGKDEVLLAVDALYEKASDKLSNFIRDDEIREQFVAKLPNKVRCVLIFDCCHSGTAADLSYSDCLLTPTSPVRDATTKTSGSYAKMKVQVFAHCPPNEPSEPCSDSDSHKAVTAWSACHDDQITYGGQKGGVFMKAFVRALNKQPQPTNKELLMALTKELDHVVKKKNDQIRKLKGSSVTKKDLRDVPRPQLGSLQPSDVIEKMQFTL